MKKLVLLVALIGCLTFQSCNSDEPTTLDEYVNSWIYVNMEFWYYWNTSIPEKSGLNRYPEDFYESLLSANDRFSFIYPDYDELIALLNGVTLESGFEYKLYREDGSETNVIMQLTYIKPNSPAATLGLQRGDIIYQINGTQFTVDNYRTVLGQMNTQYTAHYRRYNANSEAFENQPQVSISPVVYAENPIFMTKVIEAGDKKIGYIIYNFFSPGTSGAYDDAVDAAFAQFKSAGINELIVDLRFNSGGSVASAVNLASLIAKNVSSSDVVLRQSFNQDVTNLIVNDPQYGPEFLVEYFESKTENIGSQISDKVYFIVSDRTASASEMVINSVHPFIDVYLVGETTVGKDVGSITLNDENNKKNKWALQPIVVKLVNRDNEDYPNGFTPNLELEDNFLILQPLGDESEPLLSATLAAIGVVPARMDKSSVFQHQPIFESIDRKKWNQKMLLNTPERVQPILMEE